MIMTEKLQKQLDALTLEYTTSEIEIEGNQYILVSIYTLLGQEVWGVINPITLKLVKGIAKSSYKERYFAAARLFDMERHAKEDIIELQKLILSHEAISGIKKDFLDFIAY